MSQISIYEALALSKFDHQMFVNYIQIFKL